MLLPLIVSAKGNIKVQMDPGVRRDDGRDTASSITEFLSHLQVERRMSANTLDAYRRALPDSTSLVISPNSEFLRFLKGVEPAAKPPRTATQP